MAFALYTVRMALAWTLPTAKAKQTCWVLRVGGCASMVMQVGQVLCVRNEAHVSTASVSRCLATENYHHRGRLAEPNHCGRYGSVFADICQWLESRLSPRYYLH